MSVLLGWFPSMLLSNGSNGSVDLKSTTPYIPIRVHRNNVTQRRPERQCVYFRWWTFIRRTHLKFNYCYWFDESAMRASRCDGGGPAAPLCGRTRILLLVVLRPDRRPAGPRCTSRNLSWFGHVRRGCQPTALGWQNTHSIPDNNARYLKAFSPNDLIKETSICVFARDTCVSNVEFKFILFKHVF